MGSDMKDDLSVTVVEDVEEGGKEVDDEDGGGYITFSDGNTTISCPVSEYTGSDFSGFD